MRARELHYTYDDLLGSQPDARLLRLVGDLDALATVPEPPAQLEVALARSLERRTRERMGRHVLPKRRRFPRRLGILPLLAVMLIIVAIPVAAYQSIPAIQGALQGDNGTRLVMTGRLGHPLNLAQTIAGYTVTVRWASADANRIVVAYTVQQPDGQPLQRRVLSGSSLRDAHGDDLRFLGGAENLGGAYVESFDGAGVVPSSGQIELHLAIPLFTALQQTDIANPPATPLVIPQAQARPFVFDFTIPAAAQTTPAGQAASRVVPVNQTVTVAGQAVTLERVVLSPSETRLYLRGEGINTSQPLPVPVLIAGDWNSEQPSTWAAGTSIDSRDWKTNGGLAVSFLTPLTNKHGLWTLIVNPREQVVGPQSTPSARGGPWIFHFHMP
jgi:hypothetical protein